MALKIEFMDGELAGKTVEFGDNVDSIKIGRDPEQCQVVIPPDMRTVGREHCTVSRIRGLYYMEMAPDRRVSLDGSLMDTVQALPMACVVQVGPEGPKLRLTTVRSGGLASTMQQGIDAEDLYRRAEGAADAVDVESARSEARQSSKAAGIAIVVAVLVLGVGAIVWYTLDRDVGSIEETQARNTETIEGIEGAVTDLGAELPAALELASKSTYLVIRRSPDGIEEPFGTAWVAAPGRLATNAHVAERFHDLQEGQSIVLRSIGGDREFECTGTTIHPGYDSFSGLWGEYVPIQINAMNESDPIRSAGVAADVALIHVDESAPIGEPLVFASAESHGSLKPGDPVGYVGFPVENMALGGVNLTAPVPQSQVGHITAITDYFNGPADEDHGLLIQHSLPATGGASGSPLINAHGEVVGLLSAVNFIVVGSKRIPSAASVNFAQRSTLLQELDSPGLEQLQQARTARWQDQIGSLYASGRLANRAPEMEDLIAGWENMVSARIGDEIVTDSESVELGLFPLGSLNINPLAMGAGDSLGAQIFGKEFEFQVEAGREYLLAVEGDSEIVNELSGDVRVVDVMDIKPNLKAIAFRAERSGTVKAVIGAKEPSGTVSFDLRVAKIELASHETVARAAMRRWVRDLSRRDGQTLQGNLVRQWSGEMASASNGGAASEDMELDAAGRWFIVAVCMEHEDIKLKLLDTDGTIITEDKQPDWYPFVSIETRGTQKMKAALASTKPGLPYRLFLYKASQQAGG